MKILFVTIDGDPQYVGGTATIVKLMAKWLKSRGHYCALGVFQELIPHCTCFEDRILLSIDNREKIKELNDRYNFDILYITQCVGIDWKFLRESFPQAKLIAAYHNRPMFMCPQKEDLLKLAKRSRCLYEKLKLFCYSSLYPLYKRQFQKKEQRNFCEMASCADKIQLLSEGFRPLLKQIIPKLTDLHIVTIANPVVYSNKISLNLINTKLNEVLAVCNANNQKRANLIIEVWRYIESDPLFNGWHLTFVGDSYEVQQLKSKAIDVYKLKRIIFEGRQDPKKYYERASIFMLTSRFEGWPMVLMEAMPMGCVPIVFDSFESLHDIIKDKENGIIIPNNNVRKYIDGLKWLIMNSEERQIMAVNATKIFDMYSVDSVMSKYEDLFCSLI